MKLCQICLLFLLSLLYSCAVSPSKFNTIDFEASYLNVKEGEWLLNYVDTDLQGKGRENFMKVLSNGFSDNGCDSIYYVGDLDFQYIIPSAFIFDVSKETLNTLKSTTEYDYLICSRARILEKKYEFYTSPTHKSVLKRETEVVINIYDVHSGICIYSHRILGSNSVDQNEEYIHISKNTSGLMFKSLKKIIKELRTYSGPIPL